MANPKNQYPNSTKDLVAKVTPLYKLRLLMSFLSTIKKIGKTKKLGWHTSYKNMMEWNGAYGEYQTINDNHLIIFLFF